MTRRYNVEKLISKYGADANATSSAPSIGSALAAQTRRDLRQSVRQVDVDERPRLIVRRDCVPDGQNRCTADAGRVALGRASADVGALAIVVAVVVRSRVD